MKDKRMKKGKERKPIESSVWFGHCFELLVLRTFWKLHEISSLRAVYPGTKGRRKKRGSGEEAIIHQLSTSSVKCGPKGAKDPNTVCTFA